LSDISVINRSYYEQRRNTSYDDSDSEVDSYVSPDEWAIRQRGRRLPVVFSPNIDDIKQVIINLLDFIYLDVKCFLNISVSKKSSKD